MQVLVESSAKAWSVTKVMMTGVLFLASSSIKHSRGLPLLEGRAKRALKKGLFPSEGNRKKQAYHELANSYERNDRPCIVNPIVNLATKDWPN